MAIVNAFDISVLEFIQTYFHNAVTDLIFPIITFLGEGGFIWILTALVFIIIKKRRPWGILILCAMALGFLIGEVILKNIICRERPFVVFPEGAQLIISPPSGFSFPSGHSVSSFAAATVIFYFNRKYGIAAYCLAALIAFSRIFLFVHFPTDAIAGIILGVLCAAAVILVYRNFFKTKSASADNPAPPAGDS